MLDFAKTEALIELNLKLLNYKDQRRKKNAEIKDLEEALEKLEKKRFEIEAGLQTTADEIARRLEKIPEQTKFRRVYFEEAKSKFMNAKSNQALEHMRWAETTAKNKIIDLEEAVQALNRNIRKVEDQIDQLKKQV